MIIIVKYFSVFSGDHAPDHDQTPARGIEGEEAEVEIGKEIGAGTEVEIRKEGREALLF